MDDEEGRPRIVAEVVRDVAELRVATGNPSTHLLLYAGPVGEEHPSDGLGLELFVDGDSVVQVHAWAGENGWEWAVTTEP